MFTERGVYTHTYINTLGCVCVCPKAGRIIFGGHFAFRNHYYCDGVRRGVIKNNERCHDVTYAAPHFNADDCVPHELYVPSLIMI